MSKWGTKLAEAVGRAGEVANKAAQQINLAGVAGVKAVEQARAKAKAKAERAAAKTRKADQERGHVWESKMKRRD